MYKAIVKSETELNSLLTCKGFRVSRFVDGDKVLVGGQPLVMVNGEWVDLVEHEAEVQKAEAEVQKAEAEVQKVEAEAQKTKEEAEAKTETSSK